MRRCTFCKKEVRSNNSTGICSNCYGSIYAVILNPGKTKTLIKVIQKRMGLLE